MDCLQHASPEQPDHDVSFPLDDAGAGEFFRLVSDYAAPHLFRDGTWTADYRRLRIAGRKLPRTDAPPGA